MSVDHLGIAVKDLDAALRAWTPLAGAPVHPPELVESQGVRVAFLEPPGSHVELLQPVRPDSPVGRFLASRGEGMHHLAFHVPSVADALRDAEARGARLIDRSPRSGARGRRVGFLHPSASTGVLVEFVEGP
jgi:methylmalonyl-CoA/ethylmalonyl-CoA epimerase